MIVMILVIVWLAVLVPMAVRYLRDGRSGDSIESFHEQMHLLERAGPKLVVPAHSLERVDLDGVHPDGAGQATGELVSGGWPSSRTGGWRNRESSSDGVREMGSHAGLYVLEEPGSNAMVAGRARLRRRRQGQRRRRDLVLIATATAVLTGGLGAVGGLHLLWIVTGVSAMLVAGCAALGAYAEVLDVDRRVSVPTPSVRSTVPPPSPWSVGPVTEAPRVRSREAIASVWAAQAGNWAAKAGFPGAWDEAAGDELDDADVRRVAVGG